MTIASMYNFQSLSKKFCDFQKFNFSTFTPQVRLFFVGKRKPKISGFKNVMERGINFFAYCAKFHLKFQGR